MRRTWLTSRASVSASEPFTSSSAPSAPSSVPLWFISSYRRQHDEKHGRAHARETTEPGSAWLSPCSPPVEAMHAALGTLVPGSSFIMPQPVASSGFA